MSQRPGTHPASRSAESTASGKRGAVMRRCSFAVGVGVWGGRVADGADAEVGEQRGAGAARRGEAAVLGIAVLADPAGGQLRVLQRALGLAAAERLAGGPLAAGGVDRGEVLREQHRL